MSSQEGWTDFPQDFSGIVRLFPLPNLVMFPHAIQALRLFEPRYRAMFEDAMHHDHLLAMALLLPGWEKEYFQRPPIAPVVCIGRVLSHFREANGDYRLMLLGMKRARIAEELTDTQPFRTARVELLADVYGDSGLPRRAEMQRQLLAGCQRFLAEGTAIQRHYELLLEGQAPLGPLTDIVAYYLGLPPEVKQQLLEELDVDRRAERLLELLDAEQWRRSFPPDFSNN